MLRGADRKANALVLVQVSRPYSREVRVELPLRLPARAAPPSGPRLLRESLQERVQEECLLMGADRKANTSGLHVPERSNGAPFESIAELVDARTSVGAIAIHVDAAEGILMEAATRKGRCEWGTDRKANAV